MPFLKKKSLGKESVFRQPFVKRLFGLTVAFTGTQVRILSPAHFFFFRKKENVH